ncbi:DnaJ domain-containing protein [Butyrivibrio fibrisolvens DSM 3071]|uniref:DnaJ domain-containing protein n=1 Tax=Butyrivibrio fibrisolvens DSM 3071 TaxID=1121131 RepID=A0A1M5QCD5_BUTFI|nr:DnaJ domain-containing protein [Butyrivibrio fibrisolvens]SHH11516.1 DnaJ domain-containing protein [Butyrivibrio fibrisolvens DSM 3071]
MTLKEAYKILGISKKDDDRKIKTKYKKLLIMYHPDSDPSRKRNPDDDEKIRQIIEAYKKIKESEGKPVLDTYEFTWDAIENKSAFSERNIYVQFKMYDEELPLSKMARGRFVWDPDMEEFSLFSKSVLEACKEVITDYDVMPTADRIKDIFHLMMQEYVLPADSARKIGKLVREDKDNEVYQFNGYIKNNILDIKALSLIIGEPASIVVKDERAVACEIVTGKKIGDISFDQDELYYVLLPLLKNPQIEAHSILKKIENSRRGSNLVKVIIELALPKRLTDIAVSNDMLIKQLLKEK